MIWLYRFVQLILSPVIDVVIGVRLLRGKEEWSRMNERLGAPKHPRPKGKLLWLHGASVGEMQSVLPLIDTLLNTHKDLHVLVTTGTRTSANLAAKRLPKRCIHQYVPLDYYLSVKGFMDHWQPDISVFVESEFWPELLRAAPNPILLNGRMSDKSYKRYRLFSAWTHMVLNPFNLCLTQSADDTERFKKLGAKNVYTNGNIKYDAAPLPVDADMLKNLRHSLDGRPLLVAASTHDPEEEMVALVHTALRQNIPKLLTLIAPRHPHRGVTIAEALNQQGHTIARRALRQPITDQTDIYIADTIGEMGLWYSLAGAVVIGGSFIPHGGQNPIECLKLGAAPVCGPHMENFREVTQLLTQAGVLTQVEDAKTLTSVLANLLGNTTTQAAVGKKSKVTLTTLQGASARAAEHISAALTSQKGRA